MRQSQAGFTLIELMVVIVIIGILVAIALPNFIGATDRAKVANVKSNAHTVQTMLESYGVDFGGKYPDTTDGLRQEALTGAYFKNIINPFDPPGNSVCEISDPAVAGAIAYEQTSADDTKYFIYGYDKNKLFVKDKGSNFVLTNS